MTSFVAGPAGLAACVALAVAAGVRAARASGEDAAGGCWILVAAVTAQLGATAFTLSLLSLLSFPHALAPASWLSVQCTLAGIVFAVSRRTGCGHEGRGRLVGDPKPHDADEGRSGVDLVAAALLAVAAWALALSFVEQVRKPIGAIDDLTYVAARVAHWMQNGDLLRYTTGNERQVVFPFGGDLFLLLPLLFTKSEAVGRAIVWTALPATLAGLGLLLREAGAGRRATALALVVFATTPLVYGRSIGVKPELWATLHVLGALFWTARAARRGDRRAWALAGLSAALALGAKPTTIGALPALALAPLLVARRSSLLVDAARQRIAPADPPRWRAAFQDATSLAAGFVAGLLVGGAALPLAQNVAAGDTPFGSKAMVAVHAAEPGFAHVPVHAARFALRLVDLPFVPENARVPLTTAMQAVGDGLGANARLPLERETGWPGAFEWQASTLARRFSLAGLAWIPILAVALSRLALGPRNRRREDARADPAALAALVSASLLAAVVFGSR